MFNPDRFIKVKSLRRPVESLGMGEDIGVSSNNF